MKRKTWVVMGVALFALSVGCGGGSSGGNGGGGSGVSTGRGSGGASGKGSGGSAGGSGGSSGGSDSGGKGGDVAGKGGNSGGSGGVAAGSGGSGGAGPGSGGSGVGGDSASAPDAGAEVQDAMPMEAAPPIPVPATWTGKDVGAVDKLAGSAAVTVATNDNQRIQIKAGGAAGIGGKADAFFFLHRPVTGDGQIIGRMTNLPMVVPETTAGFMIRESLDPDAAMVYVGPIGDGKTGGRVVVRTGKGKDAITTQVTPETPLLGDLKAGQWVRLLRQGNTIRVLGGSRKAISDESGSLGMATLTLAKPGAPLYFGMAASSASDMKVTNARFEEVSLDNLPAKPATRTWSAQGFGTSGGAVIWADDDTLEISGQGGPWNTVADKSRDFFQYAFFQPDIKRDSHVSLQFLVTAQGMTNPGGRVAAIYRSAADLAGINRSNTTVALSLTQGAGLELSSRGPGGEKTASVQLASKADLKAPLWLRLDRQLATFPGDPLGRLFTQLRAYYAPDNKGVAGKWLPLGDVVSYEGVGNADYATLGIGVSAFDAAVANTAKIAKLTVTAAPSPPPVTLPKPDAGVDGGSADGGDAGK